LVNKQQAARVWQYTCPGIVQKLKKSRHKHFILLDMQPNIGVRLFSFSLFVYLGTAAHTPGFACLSKNQNTLNPFRNV
jgi:hypothetical protein